MKILSLGTYPTRRPMHGGQRRATQIGAFYRHLGIEYRYACVYVTDHYGPQDVTDDDYPYASLGGVYSAAPFLEDLGSGAFAAGLDGPYSHFRALVERYEPDAIQMEQPFMWPLVRRMRAEGLLTGVRLIYSSHNVEASLKRSLLEGAGVDRALVARIDAMIAEIELELAEQCDLVFAVSAAEADHYRAIAPGCQPLVVRNGAERPGVLVRPEGGELLKPRSFLYFVGSAYPPNIQGFESFVLGGGLYGFAPEKLFAVCGGAAEAIFQSSLYSPHADAYGDRVHFFPAPSDAELSWLRTEAKAILIPISVGGGSNLKAAEALSSTKWVVTTAKAIRSFEDFADEKGVLVASTPTEFQAAMVEAVYAPPLSLTKAQRHKREGLFWDRLLDESGLGKRVLALGASPAAAGSPRPTSVSIETGVIGTGA